jgi:phospholipase A1
MRTSGKKQIYLFSLILLFSSASYSWADNASSTNSTSAVVSTTPKANAQKAKAKTQTDQQGLENSPVIQRIENEEKVQQNPFAITFYKPTYVLPYYYTASPDTGVYMGETPENESLKKSEVKYQLSFKIPLWQHIAGLPTTLLFGYTQMSYWQLYDKSAFFRETDYEPEFFLMSEINVHLFRDWNINFFNVGAVHQSNGFGGSLERSWNRVYVSAIASSGNWAVSVRPWYVFHDATYNRQNPHMAKYLGYGQLTVAYKFYNQVFALEGRNFIEHGGRWAAATASWSFPVTKHVKGYVQVFSGYGQSLIEYNHRTNAVGLGFAFSNWV